MEGTDEETEEVAGVVEEAEVVQEEMQGDGGGEISFHALNCHDPKGRLGIVYYTY